jgi:deoxyadenosine/deoxycytidine kinase
LVSKFLVIEGLIGVGKTTLCRALRDELRAHLVLEPADDNPFLKEFYADSARFAFPAQMFYLATRYAQQQGLRQGELFSELIVSDYLFEKDRLFAEKTLSGDELALYDRFADLLGTQLVRPDLVLFLDAPTEVILARIQSRGISAERVIEPEYLDDLRDRYFELWKTYKAAPVHYVETTDLDYVNDKDARAAVLGMIRDWLAGKGAPGVPASTLFEWETQPTLFGTEAK